MNDQDTSRFMEYDSSRCECIDARTGKTQTPGGIKDAIILILLDQTSEKEIVCYLNAKKNKSGHYSVPRNGKFAKLYRLAIGENPLIRFSKSQQLMTHFIGVMFSCEYRQAMDSRALPYFKVHKIEPNRPVQNESWFKDGKLRKQSRSKITAIISSENISKSRKQVGNKLENSRKQTGNFLETEKSVNPLPVWSDVGIPSRNNVYTSRVGTYTRELNTEYMTIGTRNSGGARERIVQHFRQPGESEDEYLDRVVNDSWNL